MSYFRFMDLAEYTTIGILALYLLALGTLFVR
jgi:hypothetical protein